MILGKLNYAPCIIFCFLPSEILQNPTVEAELFIGQNWHKQGAKLKVVATGGESQIHFIVRYYYYFFFFKSKNPDLGRLE